MRKWLLGAAALASVVSGAPANAADVPLSYKPTPATAASWTGFYAGLDVGMRASRTDLTTTSHTVDGVPLDLTMFTTHEPLDGTAFRYGGYLGFNWQITPRWVVGVEGDVGSAKQTTALPGIVLPTFALTGLLNDRLSVRTAWDASARGRVGYLVTPSFLAYVTGGAAWLHFESTSTCGQPPGLCDFIGGLGFVPFSNTHSATKAGWTLGSGLETMLGSNWIARAEYRYADFGTAINADTAVFVVGLAFPPMIHNTTYEVKLRTHTATLGIAYRFGDVDPPAAAAVPDAPVYKAPPAALAPSWSGFYVGLDGGVRSTRTDVTTTSALEDGTPFDLRFDATSAPFDGSAFRFGPFVGYNLQIAPQWLVGIEGDIGWARQSTALIGIPFTPGFMPAGNPHDSLAVKTTWDAGARGRLGYLVTPSFLVYVTGGPAWLHYETTSSCAPTGCLLFLLPAVIANSTTKAGWTVGTGIETMLWGNWFARGEYRYADFGTGSFTLSRTGAPPDAGLTNYDVKMRTHTALFGIAYKFGDAGAVIAKY